MSTSLTTTTAAAAALHVIVIPHPGRGHVNPMLIFSHLLVAHLPSPAAVTVVLTDEWLSLIGGATTAPPGVRFKTLPNVIPSEKNRAADIVGFLEAVFTKMEDPFERLLDELEMPATAIIADTFLHWAVDVGRRRGVPVCSFITFSATYFSALLNFDRLPGCQELAEAENELISKYIPYRSSIRLFDLKPLSAIQNSFQLVLQAILKSVKAQCLIFNSSFELEPQVINFLRCQLHIPILPIGPTIPYLNLQHTNLKSPSQHDEEYITFLNSQPQNSVLYVSLGSFLSASKSQMDEIAYGLQASNFNFLWVARDESLRLREMICGGNRDHKGMVVTWCDQLKVLCHPSVGGFLTHCGWNSTMEAIFSGTPMLTFPIAADQAVNGRLVIDQWEVGVRLREDVKSCEVVGWEKVSELVKKVMDLEGKESREMRKRAGLLSEACRNAVEESGSSFACLNDLVKFLMKAKKESVAS